MILPAQTIYRLNIISLEGKFQDQLPGQDAILEKE